MKFAENFLLHPPSGDVRKPICACRSLLYENCCVNYVLPMMDWYFTLTELVTYNQ